MFIVLQDNVVVNVECIAGAAIAFDNYYANHKRSSRAFTPAPVISDNKVLCYFSMNGKLWKREDDPKHFDLMLSRFWSRYLI